MNTEEHIRAVCNELAEFLIGKNRSYGDSAVRPIRIFAKGLSVNDMINVRIDDKLSRLVRGETNEITLAENTEEDLLGYLILKRVAKRVAEEDETNELGNEGRMTTTELREAVEGELVEEDPQCISVHPSGARCDLNHDHHGEHFHSGEGQFKSVVWARS